MGEEVETLVQPKPSFLPFFENHAGKGLGTMGRKVRERRGSNPRPAPHRDSAQAAMIAGGQPTYASPRRSASSRRNMGQLARCRVEQVPISGDDRIGPCAYASAIR